MDKKSFFGKIIEFFKTKKGKKILIYIGIGLVVIAGIVTAAVLLDAGTVKLTNSDPNAGKISGGGMIPSGKTTTIRATAFEGYEFVSWTNPDDTVASTEAEHKLVVPKSTIYLTANWAPKHYDVTLHLDGGSAEGNPAYVTIKDETVFLNAPTKEGYTFLGWYKDAEFKEEAEDYILAGTTAPVELYARWAWSYKVTYDLKEEGASNNPDNPETYTEYRDVELKHPTYYEIADGVLTGGSYRFLGWKDTATGAIVEKLDKNWKHDVSLEAMWDTSKPVYYTTYTENGTTYVEFGRYPQQILEDKRLINEMNAAIAAGTLTADASGVYTYKNTLFVKAKATPYKNDKTNNTYFGKFSDGEDVEEGKEYFFVVEPIVWRVLSGNPNDPNSEVLLLAENVLSASVFRSDLTTRDIGGTPVYENNWEYSDVRAFLNGSFLGEAFMSGEKKYILPTTVDYSKDTANPDFKKFATGTTCVDYVYLLSYKDMRNASYGWSDSAMKEDEMKMARATDYAKAMGVYASLNKERKDSNDKVIKDENGNPISELDAAHWWLRSSGNLEHFASLTTAIGSIATYYVDNTAIGVRPAITVKFN